MNKSKDGPPGRVWKRNFSTCKSRVLKSFVLFSFVFWIIHWNIYLSSKKECDLFFTNIETSKIIKNPEKVTKVENSFLDTVNIGKNIHLKGRPKCL